MRTNLLLAAACAATISLHASGELRRIPFSEIRANTVALRTVDKESDEYQGLVRSIRATGVLSAITVRLKKDKETGAPYYEVIDGLHRFMASIDAGTMLDGTPITDIPAQILTMGDAEVLEAQIIGNIHKVETEPGEYSKQLVRILQANPLMTEAELSVKLGKSPTWVADRLKLVNLTPEAYKLVNEGHIGLTNAYALAQLPKEEQPDWLVRAQTIPPDQFPVMAATRRKEINKAKREGKAPAEESFNPTAHCRRISEITDEIANLKAITTLVNTHAAGDPLVAAKLVLQWVVNLDPETLKVRESQFNADLATRKADKAKRQQERAAQREVEAKAREARVAGVTV